ncbi:VOC family protein [Uliginosibacterium gangwonense]|uniref:VOC family protein n=1 Tax=Uliginosibacterium gangwonense TaxID=392736 RepID=UPI000382D091|nr:VOC family protein [Uliginosibacterium gangwonense]
MIGYVTFGTNDLQRAAAFYDALFTVTGAKRYINSERFVSWSAAPNTPTLGVIKPFDGQPATVGNGTMVSLYLPSTALVDALHKKALELGGKDEGAPGPRGEGGFYGAYFRDLDGNKLAAFTMTK